MRAYLHLVPRNEESSRFYQVLDKDYDLKIGETFHYTQEHFYDLDEEMRLLFEKSGLTIGEYVVEYIEIQKNDYWGDLRLLHMRLK